MSELHRKVGDLTRGQQNVIRKEGWDWECLAPAQLQAYISSKIWQLHAARSIQDDNHRKARMRFLLGSIKIGLQLKAIMHAERGLYALQKRIGAMRKKALSKGWLNLFDEAFLQYLQSEEAALLATGDATQVERQ